MELIPTGYMPSPRWHVTWICFPDALVLCVIGTFFIVAVLEWVIGNVPIFSVHFHEIEHIIS